MDTHKKSIWDRLKAASFQVTGMGDAVFAESTFDRGARRVTLRSVSSWDGSFDPKLEICAVDGERVMGQGSYVASQVDHFVRLGLHNDGPGQLLYRIVTSLSPEKVIEDAQFRFMGNVYTNG